MHWCSYCLISLRFSHFEVPWEAWGYIGLRLNWSGGGSRCSKNKSNDCDCTLFPWLDRLDLPKQPITQRRHPCFLDRLSSQISKPKTKSVVMWPWVGWSGSLRMGWSTARLWHPWLHLHRLKYPGVVALTVRPTLFVHPLYITTIPCPSKVGRVKNSKVKFTTWGGVHPDLQAGPEQFPQYWVDRSSE